MSLVDGGLFTNVDLGDAVQRCRELVDREEDIIVDMVLIFDGPEELEQWSYEETLKKNSF